MTKSDYEQGVFTIPKNGYKVSEMTTAVVDCIRMFDAFYSKVGYALEMIYGDNAGEKRLNDVYFPKWYDISQLLYADLKESIETNLASITNSQNDDEILL